LRVRGKQGQDRLFYYRAECRRNWCKSGKWYQITVEERAGLSLGQPTRNLQPLSYFGEETPIRIRRRYGKRGRGKRGRIILTRKENFGNRIYPEGEQKRGKLK
jgi:hypothetical protein